MEKGTETNLSHGTLEMVNRRCETGLVTSYLRGPDLSMNYSFKHVGFYIQTFLKIFKNLLVYFTLV